MVSPPTWKLHEAFLSKTRKFSSSTQTSMKGVLWKEMVRSKNDWTCSPWRNLCILHTQLANMPLRSVAPLYNRSPEEIIQLSVTVCSLGVFLLCEFWDWPFLIPMWTSHSIRLVHSSSKSLVEMDSSLIDKPGKASICQHNWNLTDRAEITPSTLPNLHL